MLYLLTNSWCCLFNFSLFYGCTVLCHCDYNSYFLVRNNAEDFAFIYIYAFLCDVNIQLFCSFLIVLFIFLLLSCRSSLYIWIKVPVKVIYYQVFSPILWLGHSSLLWFFNKEKFLIFVKSNLLNTLCTVNLLHPI